MISFCSHILLCNIVTVILSPNFEDYLDTAKQLDEKNITIYFGPGSELNKQWLLESSLPEYNILGENAIIADDWDHWIWITVHDVMGAGTHAQMTYHVDWFELEFGEKYHPEGRGWYRSKEKLFKNPYSGYLTNKKWHLNEV